MSALYKQIQLSLFRDRIFSGDPPEREARAWAEPHS